MGQTKRQIEEAQARRRLKILVGVTGTFFALFVIVVLCVLFKDKLFGTNTSDTASVAPVEFTGTNPMATLTMEDGSVIKMELYPAKAPNTVANFVTLANDGFYDGLTFHRVISGFMIQGGDPNGTGTGGPGYTIKGEFSSNGFAQNDLSHSRGVLSMARANNPDSAGSQFFIMHADSAYLDGQYAAFGMVTEGMDVVDAIASVKTDANDKPVEDVVIASIRVETFGEEYAVQKIEK